MSTTDGKEDSIDLASLTIPERREHWARALEEDNKYFQGMGELRSDASHFCCLGVACDLYDPTRWAEDQGFTSQYYEGRGGMPPESVSEFFGISNQEARILSTHNDSRIPFNKIAKKIRENTNA